MSRFLTPGTADSANTGPPLPASLERELERAYADLDRDIAALGVGCWLSGRCCDFTRSAHRLFASSVELAYLLAAHAEPLPDAGDLCPFWREGRCTERQRRPLGCRTYFCDPRYRDSLEALYEKYYRRLREAAAREGFDWQYAPFVEALKGRGGRAPRGGASDREPD